MIYITAFVSFMSFLITAMAYNASRAQVRGLTKQVFRLTKQCTEAEMQALDMKSKMNQKYDILQTWVNAHNDLILKNTMMKDELAKFHEKLERKRLSDRMSKRKSRAIKKLNTTK